MLFNAGSDSEQQKVTTNSELNVAVAQSIGYCAKYAQNAVFDDDNPKLRVSAARLLGTGTVPT